MTTPELNELNGYLRANNGDEARRMINKNPALLQKKDDAGRTCVHWAASGGCLPLVEYAISQNSDDAVAIDDMGFSPLMIAAAAGRTEVVRYLMTNPIVCINSLNGNGQCSLHYAASKGHESIVKMLLEAQAEVNVRDRFGATPLHRAAALNRRSIIRLLTATKGIRLDVKDSEGNTPLHLACQDGCEDAMFDLVSAGADLDIYNKEEKKPLQYVQSKDVVEKLTKLAAKRG
uniref:ANK_REP_REGION domain-containing protein n=1 Tax=Steinernema glaseri TaxID=37863 RepID=A0A1I7ZFJ0_9BILA